MEFSATDCKYTNLSGDTATMRLYGHIGTDVNGHHFAEEMHYHINNGKKLQININSPGGDVFESLSVIEAMKEVKAKTHAVGMAASAAGLILIMGENPTANDYSKFMGHPPQGKNKALVAMITDDIKNIIKARTKLDDTQVSNMMNPGTETWLTAKQMKEMGLIDEIIPTGVKVFPKKLTNTLEDYKIYASLIETKDSNIKKDEMELKEIASLLKVANEADISTKITELQSAAGEKVSNMAKITNLESEVVTLKEDKSKLEVKNAELEGKVKAASQSAAETLISNALTAKKFKPESKEAWLKMAVENYEGTKTALESITGVYNSAQSQMGGSADSSVTDDYEDMAKNDPEKFREIMEKDPVRFAKMEKAYKTKKK